MAVPAHTQPATTTRAPVDASGLPDAPVPASLRAVTAGRLPQDGRPRVGGIQLPEGRRAPEGVLIWVTDEPVTGATAVAARLAAAFPRTGLWPLLWDDSDQPTSYMDPEESVKGIDAVDVPEELRTSWNALARHTEVGTRQYGAEFPGMAKRTPRTSRHQVNPFVKFAQAGEPYTPGETRRYRILLVPTRRPADTLTTTGLERLNGLDSQVLSAVLRSWEDRFGAYVIQYGEAYITLVAAAGPRSMSQAARLAAEFFALVPDQFSDTGLRGVARTLSAAGDGANLDAVAALAPGIWSLSFSG
jgi:hypothetical protein